MTLVIPGLEKRERTITTYLRTFLSICQCFTLIYFPGKYIAIFLFSKGQNQPS